MGLIREETIFVIMVILAILLFLNGLVIMSFGMKVKSKYWYAQIVILLGGLIDSLTGLIFFAFSIILL